MENPSIILIGPISAGKSSIYTCLSAALNYTPLELDELRWDYYQEIGYDAQEELTIRQSAGLEAVVRYWKAFEIHAVERILKSYPQKHVIAFGAGHSVYEDAAQFERALKALQGFPVFLLLPSPNMERNAAILRARFQAAEPEIPESLVDEIMGLNQHFLTHSSNARLATHTIYTEGKSVEESCDEILKLMESKS